jgi:predicted amidophosphoribosyltransferase
MPTLSYQCPSIGRRRWARRFNQSAALAEAISALCGVPVSHSGLKRTRSTPQQVGRSKTERADNVQGAFVVPRGAQGRDSRPASDIGR